LKEFPLNIIKLRYICVIGYKVMPLITSILYTFELNMEEKNA